MCVCVGAYGLFVLGTNPRTNPVKVLRVRPLGVFLAVGLSGLTVRILSPARFTPKASVFGYFFYKSMIWKIAINSLSAFKWGFGDWLIAKRALESNEMWGMSVGKS